MIVSVSPTTTTDHTIE